MTDAMTSSTNFSVISSEIFLLIAICVIMIVDLFQRDKERKLTFILTQLSLVTLFVLAAQDLGIDRTTAFSGHWVLDQFAIVLKLVIYLTSFVALLYA